MKITLCKFYQKKVDYLFDTIACSIYLFIFNFFGKLMNLNMIGNRYGYFCVEKIKQVLTKHTNKMSSYNND